MSTALHTQEADAPPPSSAVRPLAEARTERAKRQALVIACRERGAAIVDGVMRGRAEALDLSASNPKVGQALLVSETLVRNIRRGEVGLDFGEVVFALPPSIAEAVLESALAMVRSRQAFTKLPPELRTVSVMAKATAFAETSIKADLDGHRDDREKRAIARCAIELITEAQPFVSDSMLPPPPSGPRSARR